MKEFLALAAIVLGLALIYTFHKDRVSRAAEAAAVEAEAGKKKKPPETLSQVLAPFHAQLFAKINPDRPANLVPPLQIIRQRVAARRQQAEAAQRNLCDAALRTLDQMIPVAEERTRTLEAVLRIAARPPAALEAHKSGATSNTFFLQAAEKRWEGGLTQRKSAVDQAVAQLHRAEEELNRALGENAAAQDFDFPDLAPGNVRVERGGEATNALEQRP